MGCHVAAAAAVVVVVEIAVTVVVVAAVVVVVVQTCQLTDIFPQPTNSRIKSSRSDAVLTCSAPAHRILRHTPAHRVLRHTTAF